MLIKFLRLHNNYFYEVFTSCKKIRLCYKIYVHDSFYSSVLVIISYDFIEIQWGYSWSLRMKTGKISTYTRYCHWRLVICVDYVLFCLIELKLYEVYLVTIIPNPYHIPTLPILRDLGFGIDKQHHIIIVRWIIFLWLNFHFCDKI